MTDTIEDTMAQLLDSPDSPPSAPSAHTLPPAVEKVISLVDRFVIKYGSVQLEIFRLPTSSTAELQRYLNSLTITLRRQGIIVSYTWLYHPSEAAYYLLLFHSGSIYSSLSGVVHRLWHTSPPVTQLDNIRVSNSNYADVKDWLSRTLLALGANLLSSPSSYYRHSYGSSLIV